VPERGVDQALLTTVVQTRDDPAPAAALQVLVGLHHQAEPVRLPLRGQDTHPRLAYDADGHSWSTIGAALGVTGSAAAKRYGPTTPGPGPPAGY
jgi:hypothetical protein